MRIQGITHTRLMDESEICVSETAKFGTPAQMLVATRLLSHPETYRRWESEHALLMRQVSRHNFLHRQVTALRATALSLLHRKAIFEYLQDRPLTAAQRRRLIALFHSFKDYTSSLIAEHGNYLRGASSYWCAHHLARRLMKDSAFAEPLHLYQERYTDYFRIFCDVELADTEEEQRTVEPLRMLKPLLKMQLTEARREILSMAYQPSRVWREVEIRRPTGDTVKMRTLPGDAARLGGAAVHSGARR
ncbi:MAG TPA: hypothetical protein VFO44_02405 [Steroidobacteraceae bacterium]|nr:hypothetical protein [Steroidobacteraceae bacterium]